MYKSNRQRTRDLLLEYDARIMPPRPRPAGIKTVYPWADEYINLNMLENYLYSFAAKSGYHGSQEQFHHYFGAYLENNISNIIFDHFSNFPSSGEINKLYFDLDENILYCWANTEYIPVNTMLITNTILEGGEA